jgi:type IV pilus assembly protein PilB
MSQRLGNLLVKEKVITPEQLEQATKLQKESHTRLASALVKLGFLSDEDVTNFLSRQYSVRAINNLSYLEIDPAVVRLIPYETAKWLQILPMSRVGASLTIAMIDPTNVFAIDEIKFMTGFNIEPVVASESSIIEGIDKAYGTSKDGTRKVERVDLADGKKKFDWTWLPDGTRKTGRVEYSDGQKAFDVTTLPDGTRKIGRIEEPDGRKAFDLTGLPDGTVKGRVG